jgi:hypothetical protein
MELELVFADDRVTMFLPQTTAVCNEFFLAG